MRTELSASCFTVYAYSTLLVVIGVVVAFFDPFLLLLSAFLVPQGLLGFSFWQVFVDDSGFTVVRHGRSEFFTFEQVKSVSIGMFGLPHIVLVLRDVPRIHRVRFFPEPSHGAFFLRHHRLKRQLEGIISSARSVKQTSRAT